MSRFIIALFMTILTIPVTASASGHLSKGYIQNHEGAKCWYTQKKLEGASHFHKGLKGGTRLLTFDNPKCMSGNELEMSINKKMINNVITTPYSHADAKFKTRESELFNSSDLQVKGRCIQSQTYPAIGVTVDYIIGKGGIEKVYHSTALQGCKNK